MSDENKQKAQKTKDEQWATLSLVVELLRRYFSGVASRREQNSIETWNPIENETELLKDKTLEDECDTNSVWNAVARELNFDQEPQAQPTLKKRAYISKWQSRYAAAACIFMLLGAGILYYTHNRFTGISTAVVAEAKTFFQTDNNQSMKLTLPDGSCIQMNRGTKFSYETNTFNRKKREVWLTGEAFFEVTKNPEKPFIIHTGDMTTTVRGTSFNVKAYPQLAENVVSVRSGKVEISREKEQLALLTANRQLKYSTINRTSETSDLNWEDAAAWIEGNLVLNGAGAEELKMRLQQQFGVTVIIANDALSGKSLSGSFRKERTLKEVINTISTVYNIHYQIKDNQVTITP